MKTFVRSSYVIDDANFKEEHFQLIAGVAPEEEVLEINQKNPENLIATASEIRTTGIKSSFIHVIVHNECMIDDISELVHAFNFSWVDNSYPLNAISVAGILGYFFSPDCDVMVTSKDFNKMKCYHNINKFPIHEQGILNALHNMEVTISNEFDPSM